MSRILGSNTVRRNVVGFLPAVLWAILVAVLSLTSPVMVPSFSWADIAGLDKIGHVVFYCILALWVFFGFIKLPGRYRYMAIWTMIGCAVFGIGMETLQAWMRAGRQFEYPDILANVIGVFIAYCIFNGFLKKKYYGNLEH